MSRIVPSNFSLVTHRTRAQLFLTAANLPIHAATFDPFPSRPYNTHQVLSLCPVKKGILVPSLPLSLSVRGHCSRCGRSIKGLDGNSQLNASLNGCEEDRSPFSVCSKRATFGIPCSSCALAVSQNLNSDLVLQREIDRTRPTGRPNGTVRLHSSLRIVKNFCCIVTDRVGQSRFVNRCDILIRKRIFFE